MSASAPEKDVNEKKRTCMNVPEKRYPFGPVGKSVPVLIGHPTAQMPIQARDAVGDFQTLLLRRPHNDPPNAHGLLVPTKPTAEQRPNLRPTVGAWGH